MNFICPQALYLFLLVPLYIFLYFYFEKKKAKDIVPFGNLEILVDALTKTKEIDFLKHLPLVLKTLLLCFMVYALARPIATIYLPVKDTKIMLLIDNSISMEANDMSPNRIVAAREAAKQFINDLPRGIQVGVTMFCGNVKVLLNPTLDKNKVLKALNKLNLNILEPGTAIGDAILVGVDAITIDDVFRDKYKGNRILVLITDGEANVGNDPLFSASQAKLGNVIVHTVGIGSPLGTIIRGGILTKLDGFVLEEIASITGGFYFNAQNLQDMKKIYKKIRKTIQLVPEESEITFIPSVCAFIILTILQILKWTKFRFA